MAESLPDSFVRRQFYIVGLGNKFGDIFVDDLNKSNTEVRGLMLETLPEIKGIRPLTKARSLALERLARQISSVRGKQVTGFRISFEEALAVLVKAEYMKMNQSFNRLPLDIEADEDDEFIVPLLMQNALYDGLTVDQWFDGFTEGDYSRTLQTIAAGVNDGVTDTAIITALLGTKGQGYRDGALSASQNSARSLARTVTAGVANQSRVAWSKGMSKKKGVDLLEVFSAILDSRTSFICASLSGNTYKPGVGPIPPLHRNCRSARYPIPAILATPEKLEVPNKDFQKDARRRIGGKKFDDMTGKQQFDAVVDEQKRWLKKNVGELPESKDFEPWFNEQPKSFQRDYLGPNRYRAWQDGQMDIGKYVAPDGARYTIQELVNKGVL